ncbi:hypothetical protein ACXR2T_14945 [Leucobacter sp. HY1910]
MKLKLGGVLALSLAALSLTACGGGAAGGSPEAAAKKSGSIIEVTDQQGSIEGFVGAADDAEVTRCEADGETWVGEGTVTNPTDEAQAYRLYVAFNASRDTAGLVQVDLAEVAPGTTAKWQTQAELDGDAYDCVLRVERFAVQ